MRYDTIINIGRNNAIAAPTRGGVNEKTFAASSDKGLIRFGMKKSLALDQFLLSSDKRP